MPQRRGRSSRRTPSTRSPATSPPKAEVTQTYAERATEQFVIFLKAHADAHNNADFGMLLPTGESYRVVPTRPVDAVWHAALQISEPYTAACEAVAGRYVHHRPILTEAMQDGTAITYTLAALHATGYRVDMEFWAGEGGVLLPAQPAAARHRWLTR